ncbi:MAG: hypothetical protein AAF726_06845 [Planctomycetota bacterium]
MLSALEPAPDEALENEVPYFAATPSTIASSGGPLSHAFLERLPQDWRDADLVIDSALVWLYVGASPGPRFFHCEPFPGATKGAGARANRERDCEVIACTMGSVCPEEFAVGDAPIELAQPIEPAEPSIQGVARALAERSLAVEARVAEGTLRVESPPLWSLYRHDHTALRRFPRAARSGFHFHIRATRGSQRRTASVPRSSTGVSF